MSENLICRTTGYSCRLSFSSLYGIRRFATVFHRTMPLTHSCSLRTRHWTSRYGVHWGNATGPFVAVFTVAYH